VFATEQGEVTLRANDIRYVLRPVGGEILPSTAFTIATERGDDGQLRTLVLRGRGNGHGVGMCQWGAIARARAGDDFRAILKAYYPGAELTRAP
jgi:stage II sporulation protein D